LVRRFCGYLKESHAGVSGDPHGTRGPLPDIVMPSAGVPVPARVDGRAVRVRELAVLLQDL
jgi:hypothetical protein